MATSYVVDGATLKCSLGGTCTLKVTPGRKTFIQGKPQANVDDYSTKSIPKFSFCSIPKSKRCTPSLRGPWKNGKNDVIIEGAPALMHKSKIMCGKGGVISIQKHNQYLESDGALVLPVKVKPIEAPKEQKKESLNDFWSYRKTWVHPLKGGPTLDPTTGSRNFGAQRTVKDKNGKIIRTRYHAGIDFVAEPGREVIAMTDGVVIRISYNFYAGTDAVEVKHSDGTIGRYCEIKVSVKQNDKVKKGDVLGKIVRNTSKERTHMLHLEVYDGTGEGFLTQNNSQNYKNVPIKNYQRRCDLVDSTGAKDLKVIR